MEGRSVAGSAKDQGPLVKGGQGKRPDVLGAMVGVAAIAGIICVIAISVLEAAS